MEDDEGGNELDVGGEDVEDGVREDAGFGPLSHGIGLGAKWPCQGLS